jgi:transglutaminase-like putative cysteine protease
MKKVLSTSHLHLLLLTLALVLAAHSPNLPFWVTLTSLGFGAWRYLLNRYQWAMPSTWTLIAINVLIALGLLLTFRHLFGRDASLSLLVVMSSLKLLETKTPRDFILMIFIGYFLVGNLFMFNQTIGTFLLSIPLLILLTATLIYISLSKNQSLVFLLQLAGKLLLQAVPVMLILFVLFPRIPGPLWGLSQDALNGMTGLGDRLSFGNMSKLTQNSAIAFRVQFHGAIPSNQDLYWRGPVLWHQDDREWLMASNAVGLSREQLEKVGQPVRYTITLEPHNRLWMLLLDMPSSIPANSKLSRDYSLQANEPVRSRIRYEAESYRQYKLGAAPLSERNRVVSLQIHDNQNPRTIQLAQSIQQLTPQQKIDFILNRFRQAPFTYTLNPPILGDDPVDAFLFDTKKGFCEHYAASFVYFMRAAGVPARIVTGYQGGEFNPNGGYLIVRQSDAHAWAEVWLENQGWVRVDPTAAVSPARIERGIGEALSDTDQLPLMSRPDYPWLRNIILNIDAVNNGWNQWVLGYNDEKQFDLLTKLLGANYNLRDVIIWMMGTIMVVMSMTSYFLLRKTAVKRSPAQVIYQQYLNKLKANGLQPSATEGALDFAERCATALPHLQDEIMQIAALYNALQYSASASPSTLQALQQAVNTFKTQPNPTIRDERAR